MLSLAVRRRIRSVVRLRDEIRDQRYAKYQEGRRLAGEPCIEAQKALDRAQNELARVRASYSPRAPQELQPYEVAVRERQENLAEIRSAIAALDREVAASEPYLRCATTFCDALLKHVGLNDDLQPVVIMGGRL